MPKIVPVALVCAIFTFWTIAPAYAAPENGGTSIWDIAKNVAKDNPGKSTGGVACFLSFFIPPATLLVCGSAVLGGWVYDESGR